MSEKFILWGFSYYHNKGSNISFSSSLQYKIHVFSDKEKPIRFHSTPQGETKKTHPVFVPRIVYITELPDPQYYLKRPLAIFVEKESESWIAFRPDLDIYSTGSSVDEAIHNFSITLLDDYDIYTTPPPSSLTENALQLRHLLESLVGKINTT